MGLHLYRKLTAAFIAICMLVPLQAPVVFADDEISEPAANPPAEVQQTEDSEQTDRKQSEEKTEQDTDETQDTPEEQKDAAAEPKQDPAPSEDAPARASSGKEEAAFLMEISFSLYGEAQTEWIKETVVTVPASAAVSEAIVYLLKQCGGESVIDKDGNLQSISMDAGGETIRLSAGDRGERSGWICKVNDKTIADPISECMLREGDKLEVLFAEEPPADASASEASSESAQETLSAQGQAIKLDGTVQGDAVPGDTVQEGTVKDGTVRLMAVNDKKLNDSYGNTKDKITSIGENAKWSSDSVWLVLGLARAGQLTSAQGTAYYNSILSDLERSGSSMLSTTQSSNNSRAVLALTAAGFDPQNVDGRNLLEPLANIAYIKAQGMNGPIWALLAFDSKGYEIPKLDTGDPRTDERFQTTRDNLIQSILSSRKSDGGWAYSGTSSDVDMTAMALQALAPYYDARPDVQAAVDDALQWLSNAQGKDGSFASVGVKTSESASQVIVALTSLGIDPAKDERFLKNGKGAVDSLLSFYTKGGGFKHISGNYKYNALATMQGYYALVAYYRNLNGKNRLYDMTDAGDGFVIDVAYEKEKSDSSDKQDSADRQQKNKKTSSAKADTASAAAPTAPAALGATKGLTKSAGLIKIKGATEKAKGSISLIEAVVKRGLGEDASSYTEDDIWAIKEAYKAYLDLQPAEKLAVEKDKNWKAYSKLTAAIGKVYHIDKDRGVDVLDNKEIIMPWYVKLVVTEQDIARSQSEKIIGLLGENSRIFSTWDISFVNTLAEDETDGQNENSGWHPSNILKVNLCIPDALENNPVILHITGEGKIELLRNEIIRDEEDRYGSFDRYAQFRSDDFSVYGIAGTSGSIRKMISRTQEEEPETDHLIWIYIGMAALAALALLLVMKRRAKAAETGKR